MLEYLDQKTIYTLFHVFGAVLGAGGAYMSDLMYMRATKDRVLEKTEISFLKLGSRMVWVGLLFIVISGAFLFSLDTAKYMASSKFLVKMAIVLVLIINGVIFHFIHTPVLSRAADMPLKTSKEFTRRSVFIYVSGAISIVSWTCALILGSLRGISYSFTEGFGIYIGLVLIAVVGALIARKKVLK